MRVQLYGLLAWLVLALTGCSSGLFGLSEPSDSFIRAEYDFSEVELIAIVDVVGAIESEVMKNQVADYFTAQLLKKGYAPIERQRAQGILSQEGFSTDHVHPELYAVEAGQALQVPVVMLISIPSFGDEISITAKLIEVDTGSALWLGRTSKGYKKHKKSRGRDFTDEGFGDIFNASLYGYPSMGFGQALDAKGPESRLMTLSLEEESRISDMVKTLCKSLPTRSSRRGLGGALLGLIDDRPARTPQTPAPRVREGMRRPEPPIPMQEVESVVVQEAPAPRAPIQRPIRVEVPVQQAARVPEPELRVISPGAPAPVQRRPAVTRSQKPKSIFETGFEDALAKQPVYITEKTHQRLTPPLQPRPRPQPQPQPQPRPQPQIEPTEKKTFWGRPSKAQPEPGLKPKKSFWRDLLGLE